MVHEYYGLEAVLGQGREEHEVQRGNMATAAAMAELRWGCTRGGATRNVAYQGHDYERG